MRIHTCVYIRAYTYMRIHTCVYIHAYTCMRIHTYIHTCIHNYIKRYTMGCTDWNGKTVNPIMSSSKRTKRYGKRTQEATMGNRQEMNQCEFHRAQRLKCDTSKGSNFTCSQQVSHDRCIHFLGSCQCISIASDCQWV